MTTRKKQNKTKSKSSSNKNKSERSSSLIPVFLPVALFLLLIAAIITFNNNLGQNEETFLSNGQLEEIEKKESKNPDKSNNKVNSINNSESKKNKKQFKNSKEVKTEKAEKTEKKTTGIMEKNLTGNAGDRTESQAQLVLIIDDFGNNLEDKTILSIINSEIPLAVAVIPGLNYSEKTAELAHRNGKTVLVHMPMEADHRISGREKLLIKRRMSRRKIEEVFSAALKSVPYAQGINNHQGSSATSKKKTMSVVAQLCKQSNLWVLDSMTASNSVLYSEAVNSGNVAFKRDIFLDHIDDINSIRKNLYQAVEISKNNGRPVIIIGHPRPATWEVISGEKNKLEKLGVEFLDISSLAEQKRGEWK